MTWLVQNDDEAAIIGQLAAESDRAAVIIAATILEDRLESALKAYFQEPLKTEDRLFNPSGPLGSFAAKINLGFQMGIFGADAHRELETIKTIRNAFAHDITIKDFSSQRIKDLSNNLEIPDKYIGKTLGDLVEQKRLDMVLYEVPPANERERFMIATQIYIIHLSHSADKSTGAAPHKRRF